jgi:hypothetical protein
MKLAFMKTTNLVIPLRNFLNLALLASIWFILPTNLSAEDTSDLPPQAGIGQRSFATPDDAVKALETATQTGDTLALQEIFGPDLQQLLTGDKVQDADNAKRFAAALAQACNQVKDREDKITLEIGTNGWPMPIPLVSVGGQWHFDTAAGKEEIINRHIGKDELCAIGVCRVYVTAQQQFASANSNEDGTVIYAQQFKSTPGKRDGLYWPVSENEPASPFGALVAEAQSEGYAQHQSGGPHPFHGYYFKILTLQGAAAPGGKINYLIRGHLTGGFAMVAYPEHWDQSGIMTFVVGPDGKVFQRNLGEETARIAGKMKAYNPDDGWTLVTDQGVLDAVSEK